MRTCTERMRAEIALEQLICPSALLLELELGRFTQAFATVLAAPATHASLRELNGYTSKD